MRHFAFRFAMLSLTATILPVPVAAARTALDRDLEGYAMASCLSYVDEAALKDQGDAWASAISQRSHGDFQAFLPVAKAVKAELARTGVGVGHLDGPVGSAFSMPVLTCAEMQDRPTVQRAIATARAKLRRAYRMAR